MPANPNLSIEIPKSNFRQLPSVVVDAQHTTSSTPAATSTFLHIPTYSNRAPPAIANKPSIVANDEASRPPSRRSWIGSRFQERFSLAPAAAVSESGDGDVGGEGGKLDPMDPVVRRCDELTRAAKHNSFLHVVETPVLSSTTSTTNSSCISNVGIVSHDTVSPCRNGGSDYSRSLFTQPSQSSLAALARSQLSEEKWELRGEDGKVEVERDGKRYSVRAIGRADGEKLKKLYLCPWEQWSPRTFRKLNPQHGGSEQATSWDEKEERHSSERKGRHFRLGLPARTDQRKKWCIALLGALALAGLMADIFLLNYFLPRAIHPPPPTSAQRNSAACLALYDLSSASSSSDPLQFPCAPCISAITSSSTDPTHRTQEESRVLQFCALRDVFLFVPPEVDGTRALEEGSRGWFSNSNFDFCSWTGITCDSSTGLVSDLDLFAPNVPTSLPATIGFFASSLERFSISGNSSEWNPRGFVPLSFWELKKVKTLQVKWSALDLLQSKGAFKGWDKLETLEISGGNSSAITNLPGGLLELPKLKILTLTDVNLTGPNVLDGLAQATSLSQSLQALDLSSNSLTGGVPSFSDFRQLSQLSLAANELESMPSSLPATLTTLDLDNNSGLTGTLPVCNNVKLEVCQARGTRLAESNAGCSKCLL